MKNRKKNSLGFTLVEVVVSITLLVIVAAILLPMFPQVFSWSTKAEEQLTSSHLLDQYIFDIKRDESLQQYMASQPTVETCNRGVTPYELEGYEEKINDFTYKPKLTICQSDVEKELSLYRMNVKLMSGGKENGHTYFYMTGEGEVDE